MKKRNFISKEKSESLYTFYVSKGSYTLHNGVELDTESGKSFCKYGLPTNLILIKYRINSNRFLPVMTELDFSRTTHTKKQPVIFEYNTKRET
jgi:hypothetical protein